MRYRSIRIAEIHERHKEIRNQNEDMKNFKKSYWEKFSRRIEHDLYGNRKNYGKY